MCVYLCVYLDGVCVSADTTCCLLFEVMEPLSVSNVSPHDIV